MCLTYLFCKHCCCCCCRSKNETKNDDTSEEIEINKQHQQPNATGKTAGNEDTVIIQTMYNEKDYEDLIYITQKREIKVTVKKGAQAGIIAGLMVMGGVIVAGPVGAAVGGAVGTSVAMGMSKDVVTLNQLLEQTPVDKRADVIHCFREAIQEEFQDGIKDNPELRLVLSGGTIFGVMRYMMDRDLIENDKLEKLDVILKKIM